MVKKAIKTVYACSNNKFIKSHYVHKYFAGLIIERHQPNM